MYTVNISFFVLKPYESMFLKWVSKKYLPYLDTISIYQKKRLYAIRTNQSEDTIAYALKIGVKEIDSLEEWSNNLQISLQRELQNLFKENVLVMVSILEELTL